jgi:hypothetical protein
MLKLYEKNKAQEVKVRAKLGLNKQGDNFFIPYPRLPKLAEYIERYGPDNICTTAHIWNDVISLVNKHKGEVPFFYEVRFEDILANPEAEILKISEFCELPEITDHNAPFWQKVNEIGVVHHTNQYGNFEIVEDICRDNMKQYGYL